MKLAVMFFFIFILLMPFSPLSAQDKVVFIEVQPAKVTLKPGETQQFAAIGYTSTNKQIPFTPEWEATGGTVTPTGLYTAGAKPGVHSVIAQFYATGACGTATIIIPKPEDAQTPIPISKPEDNDEDEEEKTGPVYISVIEWETPPTVNPQIQDFTIKARVDASNAAFIKLEILPKQGNPQTLLKAPVKGMRQIFTFRGKYFKNTTNSVLLTLIDNAGKEFYTHRQMIEKSGHSPKIPLPGGYLKQKRNLPQIQEMAQKATELLKQEFPDYKLVKIRQAATQVVAGTNFFFVLEFQTSEGNVTWQLILYQDLSGNCSISQKQKLQ